MDALYGARRYFDINNITEDDISNLKELQDIACKNIKYSERDGIPRNNFMERNVYLDNNLVFKVESRVLSFVFNDCTYTCGDIRDLMSGYCGENKTIKLVKYSIYNSFIDLKEYFKFRLFIDNLSSSYSDRYEDFIQGLAKEIVSCE